MVSGGVRLRKRTPVEAAAGPVAVRRRPRQARAQASNQALQEAFVRVLLERGYAKTTIREVAAVAGVGVGTFYEYFGNMRALAAKCISETVRSCAVRAREAGAACAGRPRAELASAVMRSMLDTVCADEARWAALLLLERNVSTPAAYRRHYEQWVQLWADALGAACDPPAAPSEAGRMVHAISYGVLCQWLLTRELPLDRALLERELGAALDGYLARIG
ncbi:TetR/AcrR family transcriptional regulator [Burkholderiaceae bacterium UC74_6]